MLDVLQEEGVGCIAYSPLAQGSLTDKYLNGIPAGSRASRVGTTVADRYLSEEHLEQIRKLNEIAKNRGQTLAQMALWWILRRPEVTTVLVGASSSKQLLANLGALKGEPFTEEELGQIEKILGNAKVILR